ncbi:hypothetical protein HU200_057178 [Digitaria exilis]|uniref:CN hydrolase domain-containing protein n=1 Tax=Digitaria exilis TaxID=1010633 RepID=A0A835AHU8_9POAL|nr:hypothetical protein HU200_057178 [Digitaria exilis]
MALASLAASLPVAAARFRLRARFRRAMASASATGGAPARVGVVQMTSVGDVDANYATCSRLTKASLCSPPPSPSPSHLLMFSNEAAASGVKFLCFPEVFSFIGSKDGESVKLAEPLDGPIMQRYCSLAKLVTTQSLFDVDVPGNMVYKESRFTTAGDTIVAVDSPFGRLGLTVCYDLRFPELYQILRFKHQAQVVMHSNIVLLVPSAFTKVTGEAHWEILLRARAIETQCYVCKSIPSIFSFACAFVIAAAQAGKHNEKRESYGDSIIIDPWGTVIARLPDRLSTGFAVADLDLSKVEAVRTRMPISEVLLFWGPTITLIGSSTAIGKPRLSIS